jgi:hypothetical protein
VLYALGDDLDELLAHLDPWSEAIIAAGSYPQRVVRAEDHPFAGGHAVALQLEGSRGATTMTRSMRPTEPGRRCPGTSTRQFGVVL